MAQQKLPSEVYNSVLRASQLPEGKLKPVAGYDFNQGLDLDALLHSLGSTGFQAAHLGQAIVEVNRMLDWRLSDDPIDETAKNAYKDPKYRKGVKCNIYLGCTSNMMSSGVREIVRLLIGHKMVDVLVTTAGGIEEYLIKRLAPTYMGDFAMQGVQLHSKGHVVDCIKGHCQTWEADQSPKFYMLLGIEDIRRMKREAVFASPRKTGVIILGGGLPKHHICNANQFRNGADFAVFINTAQEFDGSDSGAPPDEAASWGRICGNANSVKVHCNATIAFPLLVSQTFAARVKLGGNESKEKMVSVGRPSLFL